MEKETLERLRRYEATLRANFDSANRSIEGMKSPRDIADEVKVAVESSARDAYEDAMSALRTEFPELVQY